MPDHKEAIEVSRRAVLAGAALYPVVAIAAPAQATASVLSASQRRTLEAFVDRLIPADENGPGALECGVANYIDRALAGPLAAEKAAFLAGLGAADAFASSAHGAALADLTPAQKDEVLSAIEKNSATGFGSSSAPFFNRVRRLTLEGMFSDPFYGGNRNFGGWDLIRYPGPRLGVSPNEQKMKVAIKPVRMSAYGGSHGH